MKKKLLLIDGNSIMNRAFYGIMGSKMLMTTDGKYTNAVYGFLAILFKNLEDLNPDYMAVSFDLKAKTARHKLYEGYKANRHGMPEELADQMPVIKDILRAMNIDIVEKEGYEGDDILGTLSKYGEAQGLDVIILSGDRDTFQLASDNITIRIPRTKAGKTETENYNRAKVLEEYGLEPVQLIEVKALQGDTSDNIPGVPGIGPKTAISLIQKYHSVKELYEKIEKDEDDLKGKQKENIVANKDMAELSRTLGEIDTNVPLEDTLENLKVEEWDKAKVLEIFEELRFQRYIDRFGLRTAGIVEQTEKENVKIEVKDITEIPNLDGKLYYYLDLQDNSNEEDIINSTNMLFRGGWTNVKLYFMIGLPTETMDDVCGIADLAQKVLEVYFAIPKEERAKQINITVSTSSFVPKPFTAFQWAKQDTRDMLIEKQNTLKSAIKSKRIRYNWHDNKTSYLEGVFARGDRRLSEVIIKAVENGCKFDGWGEHFKFDVWMQTFDELGIDPNFYTARERSYEEVLPWDHIDIGVTKNFLMRENEKAKQSVTTPNCRQKCAGCGVKSFGTGVCYE